MESSESGSPRYPLLVLEIGTEEIPARFLPSAIQRLQEQAEKVFSEYRIPCGSARAYATPRRLSLIAEIGASQEALDKEVWGPPANVAFSADGSPTRAAEAFARSQGVEIASLTRRERGKGTYLVALLREDGAPTATVLPEALRAIVLSMSFPKSMRWGHGTLRFARPIHWFFALYRNEKVAFELDGIRSGNATRGHRFLSPASFEIRDAKSYVNLLKNNYVVLDQGERRRLILEKSAALASSVDAVVIEDEELLTHVTFLVEYPCPVLCTFPPEYLALPEELLITVMKDHQKYLAVADRTGRLLNHCIVVSNTISDNAPVIRKGAEKVLKARFEDARFYFEQDRKTPSRDRAEGLRRLIFHDRLGTVYEKVSRISSLCAFIAERTGTPDREALLTAASLCKSDLISGVVREFPELQGIMGGYYARHDGYTADVADAISEHYLPRHSGDTLPAGELGAILSIADKLDSVVSFFSAGLTPTGNEDPFALRRQAIGIITILLDRDYDVTLADLVRKALESCVPEDTEKTYAEILPFFEQRAENLLAARGYSPDVIQAVMPFAADNTFQAIKARLDALALFKSDEAYPALLLTIKRVNNIAPKEAGQPARRELLAQEEEIVLFEKAEALARDMEPLMRDNRCREALSLIRSVAEPVNRFFDKVLVMDKDEETRTNRLALIGSVRRLFFRIADFSKLS